MQSETLFRIIAAAILVLGAPVGSYHRLRAQKLGAKVTRVQEPPFIRYPLRLCALVGAGFLLAWFARPAAVAWAALPLPTWARWIGAGIGMASVPLLGWTFHTLGLNLTDTVATRANSYLVTGGPYRWVRHPFYVVIALFFAGFSLLCTLWPFIVAAVVVLSLLVLRTPIEEKKLIERFGDDYINYAAKTGRYLPRICSRSSPRPGR